MIIIYFFFWWSWIEVHLFSFLFLPEVELRDEGADPSKVTDKLFFFNPATKVYEPLGQAEFQQHFGGAKVKAKL